MDPMELGLRDWLIIIGPLMIAGILLHGYFRMRRNANKLKMDLDRDFVSRIGDRLEMDELQLLRAELPSGGARVVKPPTQAALDLDDDVPVLMDPVENPDEDGVPLSARDEEPEVQRDGRPDRLIVMHVFARDAAFSGQELLENLVNYGLKYGEMNIFHGYEEGSGHIEFSLVNAVEPGTFDLQKMSSIETPGVSLFMELQYQEHAVDAFEHMLGVARRLAQDMGGELRDSDRNLMTSQTIEHYRQSVVDYTMKHG